jgi:hypothetical protein
MNTKLVRLSLAYVLVMLFLVAPVYALDRIQLSPLLKQKIITKLVPRLDIVAIPEHSDTCASPSKVTVNTVGWENGILRLEGMVTGRIEAPGDVDWFEVTLPMKNSSAWVFAETSGATDTYGELYTDCSANPVGFDDNSADGVNFRIFVGTGGGPYYVMVAHADESSGIGTYTLKITVVVPFS